MSKLFFILGFALIALPILASLFLKVPAQRLAMLFRLLAGLVTIGVGTVLATRGLALVGGPLVFFGIMMLSRAFGLGPFGLSRRTPGQNSHVRTKVLSMELDHDTGTMDGEVLSGELTGHRLSDLGLDELIVVMEACLVAGDQSQALLEAYLDRTFPDWRDNHETSGAHQTPGNSAMTIEEACDILGVSPTASRREVTSAHRKLMKKFHPDQGGSDYLAARINQAKDLLLGKL